MRSRRDKAADRVHGSPGMTLVTAGLASSGLCSLLLATGSHGESPLGVPSYWPWLLTGLQVLALWSAGRGRPWGWLLGGSVQLPWIVYAPLTSQLGFIPGCAVSAAVQVHSFRLSTHGASPVTHRRLRSRRLTRVLTAPTIGVGSG